MESTNKTILTDVHEVDLIYRGKKASDCPPIRSSKDAYNILMKCWDENKIDLVQEFKILLLDRFNCAQGIATVASGGRYSGTIDLHIIFATAIKSLASGIIMAYNHPTGNIAENTVDIEIASKFSEAARALDLELCDYMIVTKEGYTSLSDLKVPPFGHETRNM